MVCWKVVLFSVFHFLAPIIVPFSCSVRIWLWTHRSFTAIAAIWFVVRMTSGLGSRWIQSDPIDDYQVLSELEHSGSKGSKEASLLCMVGVFDHTIREKRPSWTWSCYVIRWLWIRVFFAVQLAIICGSPCDDGQIIRTYLCWSILVHLLAWAWAVGSSSSHSFITAAIRGWAARQCYTVDIRIQCRPLFTVSSPSCTQSTWSIDTHITLMLV